MFFQEEFGFPKCGKIFSGHLGGKKVKTFVKHGDASQWGTNFSKLVNSYALKTFFLISTPDYNILIKNNRNVYIYIKCYTAQAKKRKVYKVSTTLALLSFLLGFPILFYLIYLFFNVFLFFSWFSLKHMFGYSQSQQHNGKLYIHTSTHCWKSYSEEVKHHSI